MKPKILLLEPIHDKAREILEEVADIVYSEIAAEAYDFDISIVWTGLKPTNTNAIVACPCTGVEHIQAPKIIHLDDEWKRTEGQEITSTAEHTWSLILQLAKMRRMQLSEKRIGIIGSGRIGNIVKYYSYGFNTNTYEVDTKFFEEKNKDYELLLEKCLKIADIITLHVPLNEETKGMIGREQFAIMKDGALLINTSRQQIVNTDELIPYLQSGKIFYADDFKNERDLTEYGAIQTEHIGGNCFEAREATDYYIAKKLVEYIKGGGI